MDSKLVFYKCEHCGNVVVKLHDSGVPLVCCGEEMVTLVADSTDAATEKHVPQVTVTGNSMHVQVGSVEHPMLDVHWIEFIVVETKKGFQMKWLNPGDAPVADFVLDPEDEALRVFEMCNIHGLWVTEL